MAHRMSLRVAAAAAVLAAACAPAQAGTLYVQGVSAALRAQPDYAATVVATVERGAALEATAAAEGAGAWVPVSYRGQKAWAPRSLLGSAPPKARFSWSEFVSYVGRMVGSRVDSRQRVSDSTLVVTGVRGLGAEDRARREDRGTGPRDYAAVGRMEALELTAEEIQRFHDGLRREAAGKGR